MDRLPRCYTVGIVTVSNEHRHTAGTGTLNFIGKTPNFLMLYQRDHATVGLPHYHRRHDSRTYATLTLIVFIGDANLLIIVTRDVNANID